MPTRIRARALVVLAACCLAALPLVAGCTGTQSDTGTEPPPPTTEHRGPAGVVPSGLRTYYSQPLTWGPCAPYATTVTTRQAYADIDLRCARLMVPLDYDHPDGTTISLGLLRLPATDQQHRIGSLVMNPGGPGESGMLVAASLAGMVRQSGLGKRFDLVGFDPRGVGSSKPVIQCRTDTQQDRVRALDLGVGTSDAAIARTQRHERKYADLCADRTRYGKRMLANMDTATVAKDMDVLRSALGDKKLTYVGFSYGTRLGTSYAEQFPHNVRAMVLDGAVDPTQGPVEQAVAQAKGFQAAFEKFAAWCARRKHCALGTDPGNATQAYRGLVNPLIENPVPAGGGRTLTYNDATTATVQALYSQRLWQLLNAGLNRLRQGHGRTLMTLADLYLGRGRNGHYSTLQDAFNAVHCVDDPRVTDPHTLIRENRRYKQAAPFLDDGKPAVAEKEICAYWPVPTTGSPHLPHVTNTATPLVISTTHDPATPYQAGVDLAKALHGRLLTFEGTQHTAFLKGNECIDGTAARYLIHLKLPPKGKRCS